MFIKYLQDFQERTNNCHYLYLLFTLEASIYFHTTNIDQFCSFLTKRQTVKVHKYLLLYHFSQEPEHHAANSLETSPLAAGTHSQPYLYAGFLNIFYIGQASLSM